MSDEIPFQIQCQDDVTIIQVSETISERDRITIFSNELYRFVSEEKPPKVQVSFEQVKFFGSETLTALIRAHRRVREYGGQMVLCGMADDVRRVFKLCNLDGPVFQIYDSCQEAIESMDG